MQLCEKHPYIKSRIDQEEVAFKYADDDMGVAVLELPYIFGTQPGRRPVWVILIKQLQRFEKMPLTMYPKGRYYNAYRSSGRRSYRRCGGTD
ncbi:MAG: hypothetical protein LUG95_08075 [Clostridiales bacterium]|nr:hypothetical protein [Clostridiales bacterium]